MGLSKYNAPTLWHSKLLKEQVGRAFFYILKIIADRSNGISTKVRPALIKYVDRIYMGYQYCIIDLLNNGFNMLLPVSISI